MKDNQATHTHRNKQLTLPKIILVTVIAALCGSFFLYYHRLYEPITREEAEVVSGKFEAHDSTSDIHTIVLQGGAAYDVYSEVETAAFCNEIKALEKGTRLRLTINPKNRYVIEVATDTAVLLDFQDSQQAMHADTKWFAVMAIVIFSLAGLLVLLFIFQTIYGRRETQKHQEEPDHTSPLRPADMDGKCRILLEENKDGYRICYRRRNHTNELVINGAVYDEKKGVLEFCHILCAKIDGHHIEAGLDESSCSFICFDDEIIAEKKRYL